MLRIAAFASSVVASTATVLPLSKPAAPSRCCTHVSEDDAVTLEVDDPHRVQEIVV